MQCFCLSPKNESSATCGEFWRNFFNFVQFLGSELLLFAVAWGDWIWQFWIDTKLVGTLTISMVQKFAKLGTFCSFYGFKTRRRRISDLFRFFTILLSSLVLEGTSAIVLVSIFPQSYWDQTNIIIQSAWTSGSLELSQTHLATPIPIDNTQKSYHDLFINFNPFLLTQANLCSHFN